MFQELIQKTLVIITSILVGVTGVFTGQKLLPSPTPSPIVEQQPSPSLTPSITPSPTNITRPTSTKAVITQPKQKWDFTQDQYEITISNVSYKTDYRIQENPDSKYYSVKGDLLIKNISVKPFITGFGISKPCKIEKDGNLTNFKVSSFGFGSIFPKALLLGETITIPLSDEIISVGDYDSQGNIIKPNIEGAKIKSCTLKVQTKDKSNIEPKEVVFPK